MLPTVAPNNTLNWTERYMALNMHWMALGKRVSHSGRSYFMVFRNAHPHLNKSVHLL